MTMNRSKFEAVLKELIAAKGLNKKELALKCGVSRATLYNILQGNVAEARLSTLIKLAAVLDAHPLELIKPYFSDTLSERKLAVVTKDKDSGFLNDVTYPDNSVVLPNEIFVKTWSVLNTGKEPWQDLYLSCQDQATIDNHANMEKENQLTPNQTRLSIPFTLPGDRVELSIEFQAPSKPCRVISYWKTTDAHGELLFPEKSPLSCLVKVIAI